MNQPANCPKCGATVRSDSVFCIACGHTLQGFSEPQPGPAQPSNQSSDQTPFGRPPTDPTQMYMPPSQHTPNWSQPPRSPGFGQAPGFAPVAVKNYLVESILVTIFCCMPLGVVAIIFAAQVDSQLRSGNYAQALDSSNKARTFATISFVLGILGPCCYLGLMASTLPI